MNSGVKSTRGKEDLRVKLPGSVLRAVLVLLAGLACFGCSSPLPSGAGAPRSFTLGYIPGAQDFVIFVMESQGILERYRLKPEKVKFLNPPSMHLLIAERQVDIGFGGFTTMANARAQGKDVTVVHGIYPRRYGPRRYGDDLLFEIEKRALREFLKIDGAS